MYFRASGFDLVRPGSLAEAVREHAANSNSEYLAGGTALLSSRYARGGDFPKVLISLANIDGCSGVTEVDGAVRIGALTTLAEIETDELLGRLFPTLHEAVVSSGSWQVRTRATIGGNIANGSPTADVGPSLLALGARVRYQDGEAERELDFEQLIKAPGELSTPRSAVLTTIEIPVPSGPTGSAYERLDVRQAMDTAMAGVSVSLSLDAAGTVVDARVVLAGVVPVAARVAKAERALVGSSHSNADAVGAAAEAVKSFVANSKQLRTRSSPTITGFLRRSKGASDPQHEYRKQVVPVLTARALETALARAVAQRNGASA